MRMQTSVVIDRPVEEVWKFFTNLKNTPSWTRSGSELRQSSAGPMGVGATVQSHRMLLGYDMKLQSLKVTEYEPNRTIAMSVKVGIAKGDITQRFSFEPTPAGTRLTRSGDGELRSALKPLERIFSRLLSSGWQHEFASLKRLIEAGA